VAVSRCWSPAATDTRPLLHWRRSRRPMPWRRHGVAAAVVARQRAGARRGQAGKRQAGVRSADQERPRRGSPWCPLGVLPQRQPG
jgi:hypothetical protein